MANGIDRIKNLMEIETDKQVIKVAEYLITREDMDEKYLNEAKNLGGMFKYITERAREQAENGCAWVDDDTVYGWAIHYWDESEDDLKKEKIERDKLSQQETKKSKKVSSEETAIQKEEDRAEQKSEQNEDDIVFKWKGKPVTRKQFNSKEYLSW